MKTWQKATFIIVLVLFIAASVTISFLSMARAPFEYEYQTALENEASVEGWVLFGFNGNNNTKEVFIDYVRDEDGNNPDKSKPVSAVGDFTMNTDDYVEVIYIGNKKSRIFHSEACPNLPSDKNRKDFISREEALNSGYKSCGNCNP